MSELKRYIIVAGINGAGKSTLYRARPELFTHSKRLNADEILQNMGGDWYIKIVITLEQCAKK